MTIKELETLVGMTRANIRFYEQEGLISPARQPNGYRDYSREDADTLSKIKLFRQLHLDLDTIRALQSGELTLAQALEKQLAELETDQTALDRARQVCLELRESGTSYVALDPKPWLAELERSPVPESSRYAPPEDRYVPPKSVQYPWRRFFARLIDLMICGAVWLAVYALGFHWNQPNNLWTALLNTYIGWGLLFLLEPLCLHFWGTTPGKALFGISIRSETGKKLTWKEARDRTWQVFGRGCGYEIPGYDLWRRWKSYQACRDGERQPWEAGEIYEITDDKVWRCWACVGVFLLNVALTALILMQAMLPPNRGSMTAAEFYENYNFYVDYLNTGTYYLDENGQWIRPDEPDYVVDLLGPQEEGLADFSLTLTDGAVTGVTFSLRTETDSYLWLSDTEAEIALLALAGSLPEINCVNFRASDWLKAIEQQTTWDYDLSLRGLLHITQNTELTGFEAEEIPSPVLSAREGQTAVFRQEFRIELEK